MTTKVFVTYGFGSNLWNCYSEVDVPAEIDVRTYVFAITLGKCAFMYSEEQWTVNGVTQQQLYNLEKWNCNPSIRSYRQPSR